MLFRYSEVTQRDFAKTHMMHELVCAATEYLCLPIIPKIRWFAEDPIGAFEMVCNAPPAGFVKSPETIWIDISCSGRWLLYVALHEVRHIKQRWDNPEDNLIYGTYPAHLKQAIEDTANSFAGSFMARSEFLSTVLPYQLIGVI